MKEITSIGHVALKVRDLEKSLAFYTEKMGFPEMFRLNREDGRVWLVYLRITDDQYLEIFPEAVQDSAPGPETNGINHFCLTVEDIEKVIRQLSEKNVALHLPLKTGADNNRQAWVRDPDGNRIEFMEMSPKALQFEAIQRLRAK
ncbi:MAG TPA: VOC family protein [Chthoniobacterales bacterium]|nr:VOC family protein [Chthoniobacterales bacterium]